MDAHLLRRFTDALLPMLEHSRLEKIQSPAPQLYTLALYTRAGKRQLCLRCGRQNAFLFLTEHRLQTGTTPTAEIMRLRKYLQGQRVLSVVAHPFQRRIWLLFSGPRPETGILPWLLIDLKEGLSLATHTPWQTPSEEIVAWPQPSDLDEAMEHWRSWPILTPRLRKTLSALPRAEQLALLTDLKTGRGDVYVYTGLDGRIASVSAWPLPNFREQQLREEHGDDVLPLLERAGQHLVFQEIARSAEDKVLAEQNRQRRRLDRLQERLDEDQARLEAMVAEQTKAELLQANLWRLDSAQKCSRLTLPTETEETSTTLSLDPKYTILENMQRLFHTAQRGKRGLLQLATRRENIASERLRLDQTTLQASLACDQRTSPELPHLPAGVQAFYSSDGFLLLRGRSAKGNLACRKLGKGHDIWLHAENGPGAHVVIRRTYPGQEVPDRTLEEAGSLAACKSWQQHADTATIQYAELRHIKPMRGAENGTVKIDKLLCTRRVPVDHGLEERLALRPKAVDRSEDKATEEPKTSLRVRPN